MGHYVLNHIYKGIAFTGVVMLVLFWLGYHGVQWLLRRYGATWRIPGQRDWAALVVLMLVISVFSFPVGDRLRMGSAAGSSMTVPMCMGRRAVHGIVGDPQAVQRSSRSRCLGRRRWMIRIRTGLVGVLDVQPSLLTRQPGRHLQRPTITPGAPGATGAVCRSTSRSELV